MLTLNNVLNGNFGNNAARYSDDDLNMEHVEFSEAIMEMEEAAEELNAIDCAIIVMESAGMDTTIQMEGAGEAVKNFFKKIWEALKKFWAWITGPFRKQTKTISENVQDAVLAIEYKEKKGELVPVTQSDVQEYRNKTADEVNVTPIPLSDKHSKLSLDSPKDNSPKLGLPDNRSDEEKFVTTIAFDVLALADINAQYIIHTKDSTSKEPNVTIDYIIGEHIDSNKLGISKISEVGEKLVNIIKSMQTFAASHHSNDEDKASYRDNITQELKNIMEGLSEAYSALDKREHKIESWANAVSNDTQCFIFGSIGMRELGKIVDSVMLNKGIKDCEATISKWMPYIDNMMKVQNNSEMVQYFKHITKLMAIYLKISKRIVDCCNTGVQRIDKIIHPRRSSLIKRGAA